MSESYVSPKVEELFMAAFQIEQAGIDTNSDNLAVHRDKAEKRLREAIQVEAAHKKRQEAQRRRRAKQSLDS